MSEISRIKKENMGFIISNDDIEAIIREDRFTKVLIRTGQGRFVCAAQYVLHYIKMVNNSKDDYVRDVSLLPGS